MVTLKILDKEFDETIENISLGNAFSMIEDYCLEHMIDEPMISTNVYKLNGGLVLYGNNVTFEIKDYHGEEEKKFLKNLVVSK